jgi:hypothetical protein
LQIGSYIKRNPLAPNIAQETSREKMMFLSSFFFCLALITQVKVEGCQPKNIFLLAGQSNMSGRGGNHNNTNNIVQWDGKIPPECTSNPKILRLAANKSWVEAHEPLHKDIDYLKTCGIGPGMPFANAILAKKTEPGEHWSGPLCYRRNQDNRMVSRD